ncbi:prepilin peptidase [Microbacterium suwonense]|uniref:Type 4 prepilin-like proteins leader peptide-processing enzyme n=1 Tax=Microbacterium suwonense TaxID=683047 RepID=A0ABN6X7B6_9MICO|nr:A24 family peptidase [Microbacterium suwonense]BDZ40596.1 type 4 prepilin-like proteins leader peptide-processing enzyme [Microbacterium suwonense]
MIDPALSGPLLAYALVVAGVFGLVIGSFLNVVIHRVPAGVSLLRRSQCPHCDEPVRAWQNVPVISWIALRGRCARCVARISLRYPLVELGTGVVFAGITWWWSRHQGVAGDRTAFAWPHDAADLSGLLFGADPWSGHVAAQALVLLALLWFAASGIALTLIDLDVRRLPASIVRIGLVVVAVLLALACVLGADVWALVRGIAGCLVLYVFYALLRGARPGGMGGGDVRLAGLIGLVLGWFGASALIIGAFAAFVLGGVYGVLLILLRGARRTTAVPFGPWMIIGAWVGLVAGPLIAGWYLGLLEPR